VTVVEQAINLDYIQIFFSKDVYTLFQDSRGESLYSLRELALIEVNS
jgi:hypothetical protein